MNGSKKCHFNLYPNNKGKGDTNTICPRLVGFAFIIFYSKCRMILCYVNQETIPSLPSGKKGRPPAYYPVADTQNRVRSGYRGDR